MFTMQPNREAASWQAERQLARELCETKGRHNYGCPHRPVSPWVRNAIARTLPVKEYTRG